jgi:hypothetical protein
MIFIKKGHYGKRNDNENIFITCLKDWLNYGGYDLRTTSYATEHN